MREYCAIRFAQYSERSAEEHVILAVSCGHHRGEQMRFHNNLNYVSSAVSPAIVKVKSHSNDVYWWYSPWLDYTWCPKLRSLYLMKHSQHGNRIEPQVVCIWLNTFVVKVCIIQQLLANHWRRQQPTVKTFNLIIFLASELHWIETRWYLAAQPFFSCFVLLRYFIYYLTVGYFIYGMAMSLINWFWTIKFWCHQVMTVCWLITWCECIAVTFITSIPCCHLHWPNAVSALYACHKTVQWKEEHKGVCQWSWHE